MLQTVWNHPPGAGQEEGVSDGYRPTCNLRQVKYVVPISDNIGRTECKLQQLWKSSYVGEDDEWRDIEIVEEE